MRQSLRDISLSVGLVALIYSTSPVGSAVTTERSFSGATAILSSTKPAADRVAPDSGFRVQGARGTLRPHNSNVVSNHFPEHRNAVAVAGVTAVAVPPNALGDMNQDGKVDLWDLLRVRNITQGIGEPASQYEQIEGDLTLDGAITGMDIAAYQLVLLNLNGLPYVLDSMGGTVSSPTVELGIPPGSMTGQAALSITPLSTSYLAQVYGIDVAGAAADSHWIMAAFRFDTDSAISLTKPVSLTISPASMPPCSLRAVNSIYEIGSDIDGDGRPDVSYSGNLTPTPDSTALTLDLPANPGLIGLSGSLGSYRTATKVASTTFFSGEQLRITGPNISERCVVHFVNRQDNMEFVAPVMRDPLGWFTIVPPHPTNFETGGLVDVFLEDRSTRVPSAVDSRGLLSETIPDVLVAWNSVLPSNPDSVLVAYFDSTLAAGQATRSLWEADTLLSPGDKLYIISLLDQATARLPEAESLVMSLPPLARAQVASLLELSGTQEPSGAHATDPDYAVSCTWDCIWETTPTAIKDEVLCHYASIYVCINSCGLNPQCLGICEGAATAACLTKTAREFWEMAHCIADCPGPEAPCPPGYVLAPNPSNSYFCPNVFSHRSKLCVEYVPYFPPPTAGYGGASHGEWLESHGPSAQAGVRADQKSCCGAVATSPYHPLMGAIVKVSGAVPLQRGAFVGGPVAYELPFGAYGVINGSGGFQLPGLPPNSQLTVSIYDPVTGLFDPDAGKVTTGNDLDLNIIYSPLIVFNPDTTSFEYTLPPGTYVVDTISASKPRIAYNVGVSSSQTGIPYNIGFCATSTLSLKIEDPGEALIYDNTNLSCASEPLTFTQPGTYKFRVAYGQSGLPGEFVIGALPEPDYASPWICCSADGVLHSDYSPFRVLSGAGTETTDTVVVLPGHTLYFPTGSALTSNGLIAGTATTGQPIILTPDPGGVQSILGQARVRGSNEMSGGGVE